MQGAWGHSIVFPETIGAGDFSCPGLRISFLYLQDGSRIELLSPCSLVQRVMHLLCFLGAVAAAWRDRGGNGWRLSHEASPPKKEVSLLIQSLPSFFETKYKQK